jgi:hypothetical protein
VQKREAVISIMRRMLSVLAAISIVILIGAEQATAAQLAYQLKIESPATVTEVTPDVTHLAVTVKYTCPAGENVNLQILVTQEDNSGFGPVTGAICTGKWETTNVDVQTNFGSGDTFRPGNARAEGRMFAANFQQVYTTTVLLKIK